MAVNLRPDHDTVATFRRSNKAAIEAAFLQALLLAREIWLLRLRKVAIDGTKIDANAFKVRSVRHDRAKQLRGQAGERHRRADEPGRSGRHRTHDPQSLPEEFARRSALSSTPPANG